MNNSSAYYLSSISSEDEFDEVFDITPIIKKNKPKNKINE